MTVNDYSEISEDTLNEGFDPGEVLPQLLNLSFVSLADAPAFVVDGH